MKRKVLLLMALILLVSAQPAAALTSNQRSTVIEATTRLPIISVIVPSSTNVLINPLQMPVRIDSEETYEQIVCRPVYIASRSDIPLKVDITITGAVKDGSDMILASSPTGGTGDQKSAFIYFEMQQANTDDWELVRWDSSYDSTKHVVITDGGTVSQKEIVTLPPMTQDREIATNGYVHFRLSGDAVKAPANAWNTSDGINVTVAFTFTPQSYV